MSVPLGVLGRARESDKPNHWFKVVDDRATSGGFFILQGWDEPDEPVEFDDWVESVDRLAKYFAELPWQIDWVGSA
jgi:predicted alpha/beta hydrolase family esterase